MIYTLSFKKFDNSMKLLVKDLKGNSKLLESWKESEIAILANIHQFLKKSPSFEFNS